MPRSRWHVGALTDILGYHWGWIIGGLLLLSPKLSAFKIAVATLSFSHQHMTGVPAFLSFRSQRFSFLKVAGFPLLCILLFVAVLLDPTKSIGEEVKFAVGLLVGYWNIWHVISQKYGVLRNYHHLSGEKTPGPKRSDQLIFYLWLPYFSWLLLLRGQYLLPGFFPEVSQEEVMGLPLKIITVSFFVLSAGVFLFFEKKSKELSLQRFSMVFGTLFLFTLFGFIEFQKAYLVLIFSHSIEYMIFAGTQQKKVWKTQTTGLVAGILILLILGLSVNYGSRVDRFGDFGSNAITFWILFHSLIHFYLDGIIWKSNKEDQRPSLLL